MLLAVAVILAILWVVLFFAVHITSFAIHIVHHSRGHLADRPPVHRQEGLTATAHRQRLQP